LFRAAREHQICLADSWIVGDILDDIEAGRRADCRTVLVDRGNETAWRMTPLRRPHFTVHSLEEAAQAILCSERGAEQAAEPAPRINVRTVPVKVQRVSADQIRGKPKNEGHYERKPVAGD
jgi:hypothetical protein